MRRELGALADERHDLLVIGGGVYGAAAAREAALRGLRTALIERDDYAAVTSWNSLKTIHGGLRELQRLDLGGVREGVRERRRMLRLAPHLVEPRGFVLAASGGPTGSLPALGAAWLAYGALSGDRCRGVEPGRRLPLGALLSRAELRRRSGDDEAPAGGLLWWDAQTYSSERVVLGFVSAAAAAGARVANHLEAGEWLRSGGRAVGVRARDRIGGGELEIRAERVLNCAGPAAPGLRARAGGRAPRPAAWSRAINLVLRRPLFGELAVGVRLRGADGGGEEQVFFASPWRGRTLLGTLHLPAGPEQSPGLSEAELERFLGAWNRARPGRRLTPDDVLLVHAGIQPAAGIGPGGDVRHAAGPLLWDHASDGLAGVVSLVGVKYTAAAAAAERAVAAVVAALGRGSPEPAGPRPLPGGEAPDVAGLEAAAVAERPKDLSADSARHLARGHGSGFRALLRLVEERPAWGAPLRPGSPVVGAELIHALREEQAETLADLVLRRCELGARGDATPEAIAACGVVAAAERGWDAERLAAECQAVEAALAAPRWETRDAEADEG